MREDDTFDLDELLHPVADHHRAVRTAVDVDFDGDVDERRRAHRRSRVNRYMTLAHNLIRHHRNGNQIVFRVPGHARQLSCGGERDALAADELRGDPLRVRRDWCKREENGGYQGGDAH